ncbi:MAG: NAD(P)-dependent glycerol-3-phosphate dehydrogenase [Actinomycetia bacterium]|nr:NAD(P)-dependent glycerol-3-phosphate dehydrogenase [Actinomycetes bacterium]
MRVAVIGAGSWGTAVCWLLDQKGHEVALWAREPEIAACVNAEHRNPVYLPDVRFSERVTASSELAPVVTGAAGVVMVTPSVGVRATAQALAPYLDDETPVIILSKGIEDGSSLLMTQVLEEELGHAGRIAGLSGPNHAEEVSRGMPSATVVASSSQDTADFFQDLFATSFFRVYTNTDLTGVEMCGTGKNVIAIACGVCDGLGFGDNAKASLMTRGLAELARLGQATGADPRTFMGLAGMGDLVVTCTSQHSRNRALGELIAQGGALQEYEERTKMVVEGALACRALHHLAHKLGIQLPITELVYALLYEGLKPEDGLTVLMDRPLGSEMI